MSSALVNRALELAEQHRLTAYEALALARTHRAAERVIAVALFVDRCVRVEPQARTLDIAVELLGRTLDATAAAAEGYARAARYVATVSRLVP